MQQLFVLDGCPGCIYKKLKAIFISTPGCSNYSCPTGVQVAYTKNWRQFPYRRLDAAIIRARRVSRLHIQKIEGNLCIDAWMQLFLLDGYLWCIYKKLKAIFISTPEHNYTSYIEFVDAKLLLWSDSYFGCNAISVWRVEQYNQMIPKI